MTAFRAFNWPSGPGLTKMTVSNIIAGLMEQGYVIECAPERNAGVGRNPIILDISPGAPKVLGVQLGREGVTAVLFDLKLRILKKEERNLWQENTDSILQKLFRAVDRPNSHTGKQYLGCGVSVVGPLDVGSGVVLNPPNFFGCPILPLRRFAEQPYRTAGGAEQRHELRCVGRKVFGAGREFHNFLYVGLSTGIGSGIIENDGLYQNSSGFAGELGHTSIDCNGPACSCGNRGCLEEYVGMPVIEARLREATGKRVITLPAFCGRQMTHTLMLVLSDVIEKITRALVNAVNLLNPQAILVGHNGTHLPARYLEQMERN